MAITGETTYDILCINIEVGGLGDQLQPFKSCAHQIKQNNQSCKGQAKGHANGMAKGHAKGMAKGHAKGNAKGHAKGHAKVHAQGNAKGHAKGEAKGQPRRQHPIPNMADDARLGNQQSERKKEQILRNTQDMNI